MSIALVTERLQLREVTMADVDDLVELDSDPEVMRYLSGGRPTPRAIIVQHRLPRWLSYYARGDGFGFWAAAERPNGAFVGWFHLRPPEGAGPDVAELGYRLRRAVWGRGYATEVAQALIERAFTALGVRRVMASTYQDNQASRRVMEKAGLRLVRTFRPTAAELASHGIDADTLQHFPGDDVEYALDRDEWERRRRMIRAT